MADLVVTVIWAFLWLTAAASWAWGVNQVSTNVECLPRTHAAICCVTLIREHRQNVTNIFVPGEDIQWTKPSLQIGTCEDESSRGFSLSDLEWYRLHVTQRICSLCIFELCRLGWKRLVCIQGDALSRRWFVVPDQSTHSAVDNLVFFVLIFADFNLVTLLTYTQRRDGVKYWDGMESYVRWL